MLKFNMKEPNGIIPAGTVFTILVISMLLFQFYLSKVNLIVKENLSALQSDEIYRDCVGEIYISRGSYTEKIKLEKPGTVRLKFTKMDYYDKTRESIGIYYVGECPP